MKPSIFITGAGGYVGRRLLNRIHLADYGNVYCLSRSSLGELPAGIEPVRGDLLDPAAYSSSLAKCETVIHLAAATGKLPASAYYRVNREGTRALIEECRRLDVPNFLHVSTIAVKFRDQPHYHYAQSKKEAETILASSGLGYTIVRPTMIFGCQAPVLGGLSKLAAAPLIPIFGAGTTAVQPIDVDDLVACLLTILQGGVWDNGVVELGGPEILSIEDLLARICRRLGRKPRTVHLPFGPIVKVLGILEKFLLPVMPLTAGQLASFACDGTIVSNPLFERHRAGMKNVDQILGS